MRIFGFEITRVKAAPPLVSSVDKLCAAIDQANEAWAELRASGNHKLKPWVLWDRKMLVVAETSTMTVFHSTEEL